MGSRRVGACLLPVWRPRQHVSPVSSSLCLEGESCLHLPDSSGSSTNWKPKLRFPAIDTVQIRTVSISPSLFQADLIDPLGGREAFCLFLQSEDHLCGEVPNTLQFMHESFGIAERTQPVLLILLRPCCREAREPLHQKAGSGGSMFKERHPLRGGPRPCQLSDRLFYHLPIACL